MSNILVSGLVNVETTARIRQFPLDYYPIDYPFFGVNMAVSGVAYNIALALTTLTDRVQLHTMTGTDFPGEYIQNEIRRAGIGTAYVKRNLRQTPASVVLYEENGRRQIHCDLKDIQQMHYGFSEKMVHDADLVVACNINFNRELLHLAKDLGKPIATDVHVLGTIHDEFNREFMELSDILFLSDEAVGENHEAFLWELSHAYDPQIIVLGRGSRGAAMYVRAENRVFELPAVNAGRVENTVGAGDALFSAFVHYYGKGYSPIDCLTRAQAFAAAKIRVSGASRGFIREEEVEELLRWN